jgi:hypothetical protein
VSLLRSVDNLDRLATPEKSGRPEAISILLSIFHPPHRFIATVAILHFF